MLDELIPFIEAPPLLPGEHERVSPVTVSTYSSTLRDHGERALRKALTNGPHGLPLMGNGDWNDGMNLVGAGGRGESTWLAWFLIDVIHHFTPLLPPGLAEPYRAAATTIAGAMEREAWDGQWYLRAFFDDGKKLGSHENAEARIDSIPQSWAAISGAGDPERTRQALQSAVQNLAPGPDRIIRLFTPPFDRSEPHPGYIQGYPPGLRENGGQYTHAAIWLALALSRVGDRAGCARLLEMLNPVEQARDLASLNRYAVEPYVVAADIYTAEGLVGRGGWSWYTGSASWFYRLWIEEVLGLRVEADHFRVEPKAPPEWKTYSFTYRPAGATYRITVTYDDGPPQVTLDGTVRLDGRVPLLAGEGVREVNVRVPNIPSQSALPHGGAEVGTIRHVDSAGVISATGAPR